MFYELRTYTFQQGKLPEYLKLAETIGRPVRGNDYGTVHGYWTVEFGTLNQVWHLWSYASYEEREQKRKALGQNARWTKEYVPAIRPLMVRQDIRFLNVVSDLKVPETPGGIYELRIYRMQPGMAGPWAQLLKSYLPMREAYSKNVGLWTGEAPQPNEAVHLWNYRDLNSRMAIRAKVGADPKWQEFLQKGAPSIVEMQSTLLIPTSYSPMK